MDMIPSNTDVGFPLTYLKGLNLLFSNSDLISQHGTETWGKNSNIHLCSWFRGADREVEQFGN